MHALKSARAEIVHVIKQVFSPIIRAETQPGLKTLHVISPLNSVLSVRHSRFIPTKQCWIVEKYNSHFTKCPSHTVKFYFDFVSLLG